MRTKILKISLSVIEYTIFSILLYFAFAYLFVDVIHSLFEYNIPVFFGTAHSVPHHIIHPIPFILTTCVAFLISIAFFLSQSPLSKLQKQITSHYLRYILFYVFWMCLASGFGGLLWSYYDIQAGLYPDTFIIIKKILSDMLLGIFVGPLFILLSAPYNVFAFLGSFLILKHNKIIETENSSI